jgi:aromatic ring hydroxylase
MLENIPNIPIQQQKTQESVDENKEESPEEEKKHKKLLDLTYGDIFKTPDSDKLFKITQIIKENVIKAKEIEYPDTKYPDKVIFIGEELEFDGNLAVEVLDRNKKKLMKKTLMEEEKGLKKLLDLTYGDIFKTPDSDELFKVIRVISEKVIKAKKIEYPDKKYPDKLRFIGEELEFDGNLLVEQRKRGDYK